MKPAPSSIFGMQQSPFSFKPSTGASTTAAGVGGASNVPATVKEEDEDKVPEPERKT